jgi:hypothetical protein
MSESNLSPEAQNRQDTARVNGKYGAQPRTIGEGAGGYLTPDPAWDSLGAGDCLEWVGPEIAVLGIDGITLHRTTTETDEENGTPSSLFVQASTMVNLKQVYDGDLNASAKLEAQQDEIDAFVRQTYGDAYPVEMGELEDDHYFDYDIQFTCDDDDLEDGETFPDDIAGIAQLLLDKTKIGNLRDDLKSGDFYRGLRAHLDAKN